MAPFWAAALAPFPNSSDLRKPLIGQALSEQWVIGGIGMDGINAVPPGRRIHGSVPLISEEGVAKYEAAVGAEESAIGLSIVKIVQFPNTIPNPPAMTFVGFNQQKEIRWIAYQRPDGSLLSVGIFADRKPYDGFFLMDKLSKKLLVNYDISAFFQGDLPPDIGVVELVDGRVVGMLSMGREAWSCVQKYLGQQPEIRKVLQTL